MNLLLEKVKTVSNTSLNQVYFIGKTLKSLDNT